jgi:hypothetical protein
MRRKTLALVALLATGCSRSETRDNEIISRPLQKDSIDGVWTDGSGPNASFSIENDSTIYDVEHWTTTPFTKQADSVMFYYPDDTIKVRLYRIHEDTLIYEYDGQRIKYWRHWEENNS